MCFIKKMIWGAGGMMALAAPACATPQDDLRRAVEYNRPALVQRLIAQGVDPNLDTRDGTPLLVDALRERHLEVAWALMRADTLDVERASAAGENALMLAAWQGQLPLVRRMVDQHGADVHKTGWTALHYAAAQGHGAVVQYLLDSGAYLDAESPNGTTPLMMAAMGGHSAVVRMLLDAGADMELRNQQQMDAIDFARRYGQDVIAAGLESRRRKLAELGIRSAEAVARPLGVDEAAGAEKKPLEVSTEGVTFR